GITLPPPIRGAAPCLPLLIQCGGTQCVLETADYLDVTKADVSLPSYGSAASPLAVQPEERSHKRGP
ncbi:MAG: hypothetical protein ACM3MN_08270, partial [Nitrospirota bacterium]